MTTTSTSSPGAGRRGSQTPRVANFPPYAYSAADEVIDLYERYAKPLDPWQKYVLTHGLGVTSEHEWAAFKVACWVPRQNGKGGVIEALELAWLFLPGMQQDLVTHSAHKYQTAQEAFRRLKAIVESSPALMRRVKSIREANGEQGIELKTGQRLAFMARTRTGGRGLSAPKVILDEAQELDGDMMASALPTMSAQPNPQVWFFGTPPDRSDAWAYNLKEDGEAGADDLAWFDWADDIDLAAVDPAELARLVLDIERAYRANPAMGDRALGGRISESFVRSEIKPSGLGDRYVYERLGVWRPRAKGGAGVITDQQWIDQADAAAARPADVALAVDINPRRTHSSILAVGPRAGGHQVMVVAYEPGTHWVVERLAQLKDRWDPVAIGLDVKGPVGSLMLELADRGMRVPDDPEKPRRGDLAVPTAGQVAAAYGLFVDGIRQRTVWHSDDAPLNLALAGASTRSLAGGTAWAAGGDADIAPLVASNLALWAYVTRAPLVTSGTYDLLQSVW